MRRFLVGVIVGLGFAVLASSAAAATLTVNTTADEKTGGDGQCSLREAIEAAGVPGSASDCGTAGHGANTIVLGPHTYDPAMPLLRSLELSSRAFRASAGTTLRYTVSRRSVTTFTVRRRARGRWVTVGALTHRDHRGVNRLHWNGRVQGRRLRRGAYRLQVSPRAGTSTGLTVTVRFSVVR